MTSMTSMPSMSAWSSMAMPMPTASMTMSSGSMPSMSASASASSTPVFNGANGKSVSGFASIFGALAAVAAFLQ
jgi:hypothetical protein